ncbi:MAG: mannonate dehydratase [Microscillaceae bacterium]|nr:mannonate dehydratase [Microscillaceae bacterium]
MLSLEKTWRWFGEKDPITLKDLRQIGVEGVVTSLHDTLPGELWAEEKILDIKNNITQAGLHWSVVESLPVSEGIKQHTADYDRLIHNYMESLKNLGKNNIRTVCYNFMPAIDWVRTDIQYLLPEGGEVMYFNYPKFIAFDLFILQRPGAEQDYTQDQKEKAAQVFQSLAPEEAQELAYNIIVRTQSFIHGSIPSDTADYKQAFLNLLAAYSDINQTKLRQHLAQFLSDVLPVAAEYGVNLCIHPDDPPFPLLGLPRIVSTLEDLQWIFGQNPSLHNGLTFCSGSLSVREDNDLGLILKTFAERVHFLHLRNNMVLGRDFYESGHIDGSANMPELIWIILQEQHRRKKEGRSDYQIPVRPDHGIKLLDDFQKDLPPGYPLVGRLAGLKEIRGIETGLNYRMNNS